MALLEQAVTKGVDIAQLEKLMDLQERWEKKEAKKAFMESLSKFQSMAPVIRKKKTAKIKSSTGASFEYKFADLGTIFVAIKKPLNECGLSVRWEFEESGDKLRCHCHVSHLDGHTETTTMQAAKDNSGAKNAIQQVGSTQTYLQRYTLIGSLGLTTAEEDNDAKTSNVLTKEQEDDYLEQWKESIDGLKTRIELQNFFISNKKAIESNDKIKKMMKDREAELKKTEITGGEPKVKIQMP